jgi:hypothetical protein
MKFSLKNTLYTLAVLFTGVASYAAKVPADLPPPTPPPPPGLPIDGGIFALFAFAILFGGFQLLQITRRQEE